METNDCQSELDILLNLEYQLANHHWADIYQMMADLSVAIYNQVDSIVLRKDEYPLIAKLAYFIQGCRKETRGSMDTYSPEMLSGVLYGRIKADIPIEKLKLFSKYLIVIKGVENNGLITIDEEWWHSCKYPWLIFVV